MSRTRESAFSCALLCAVALSACGGSSPPQPPTLQTTSFQATEEQPLTASLGARDPAGLALTISVDTPPGHGTLTGPDGTGAFTYQPAKDFSGNDSFHVMVSDPKGASTGATITIAVQRDNDPPTAAADSGRTAPGMPVTIAVLANDSDPEGDLLTPQIVTQSSSGNAVVNADGTITFTPAAGFAGTATVTYQVKNLDGDLSASASIQIQVRPLQKLVYLTSAPKIFYDDTNTAVPVTSPVDPQSMTISQNGRTVLYSATGSPGSEAWYAADLQGSLAGQYIGATGAMVGTGPVILSPDGTQVLYPVDQLAGIYNSTEVFWKGLYAGSTLKMNAGTYSTEQVNDYIFGRNPQNIFYISHAPADAAIGSTIYGTTTSTLGTATALSPVSADGDIIYGPIRSSAADAQLVYFASRGTTAGLYGLNAASPGIEVLLGPAGSNPSTGSSVGGFDVAAQGHYAAYVLQWALSGSTGPAAAYLIDLNHLGSYVPIGPGFADGTHLGTPLFSPDGQSLLLSVHTAAGVALFETSVTQPTTLVQMSPSYPATSTIGAAQYTPDGQDIVYTVDATTQGSYDLYKIQRSKPGQAVQLNQVLGTSIYGPFISVSADSTTIAYAQPVTPGGTLSLFLVDRTTPGSPFKVADNIAQVQPQQPQPFYIVP